MDYVMNPPDKKFIVADILPPPRRVQTVSQKLPASARRDGHSIQSDGVARLKPQQSADSQVHNGESVQAGSVALDQWFKKEQEARKTIQAAPLIKNPPRSPRFLMVFAVIFFLVLLGGYSIGYARGRVDITLTPKKESRAITKELRAATAPSERTSFPAELITVSKERTQTFPATGREDVRNKARGTIRVFNAFSTAPQVLVAHTRFEASDGKIYRIREPVTIPGAKKEGTSLSPSSVEVVVVAEEPGKTYNRGLTDFTIPGFKGSPRYTAFYARSVTPMEGGFMGSATVVTQKDRDEARTVVETLLREEIAQELSSSIPPTFLLVDGAHEITTDASNFTKEEKDAAENFSLTMRMQARALVFLRRDFVNAIAAEAGLPPDTVSLAKEDAVVLTVTRRSIENGIVELRAEGTAEFVWTIDAKAVTERILQEQRVSQLDEIFRSYPAIERAVVAFSPPWAKHIPRKPERIRIMVEQ